MGTKILLLGLLMIAGCGKTVSIDSSKLEQFSKVTEAESLKGQKVGMLTRGTQDIVSGTQLAGVSIEVDTKIYSISKYHSNQAYVFINSFPKGTKVAVKFKGEIKPTEIVIQSIE